MPGTFQMHKQPHKVLILLQCNFSKLYSKSCMHNKLDEITCPLLYQVPHLKAYLLASHMNSKGRVQFRATIIGAITVTPPT